MIGAISGVNSFNAGNHQIKQLGLYELFQSWKRVKTNTMKWHCHLFFTAHYDFKLFMSPLFWPFVPHHRQTNSRKFLNLVSVLWVPSVLSQPSWIFVFRIENSIIEKSNNTSSVDLYNKQKFFLVDSTIVFC